MNLEPSEVGRLRDFLDGRLTRLKPTLRQHAEREDPIGLVYPYLHSRKDAEIVALLASCLAYGQRKAFIPIVSRILSEMGTSPYDFVMSDGYTRKFDWFKYRFNVTDDLRCLLFALKQVLEAYGSLESALVICQNPGDLFPVKSSLSGFVSLFRDLDFSLCGTSRSGSPGFLYFLPDSSSGSACKRLNMLLRWMLRKDEVDLGLWTGISTNHLVVPLDTHVHNVSLKLGLTHNCGSTWKCAEDITHSLRQLDPLDPMKYDFLLFSMGAWKEL